MSGILPFFRKLFEGNTEKPKVPDSEADTPRGLLCTVSKINGYETELNFSEQLLGALAKGRRSVVVLRTHDGIYAQGTFRYRQGDSSTFKAWGELGWYLSEGFFELMAG